MRLSTVFVSSAFVFAGMSAALPRESENILVARFADYDFLAEIDARAYDEKPEPYDQGGAISTKIHKSLSATSRYHRSEHDNDLVARGYVIARDGSGGTPPYTSHYRHSFYEPPRYELTRRHLWDNRNGRPGTSSSRSSPSTTPGSSRPTTPGFSTPPTPGSSTPPTPGTPSSRASTFVSNWRDMPSTPGSMTPNSPGTTYVPSSPVSSRSSSPDWRRVPSTPGSSRPGSPDIPYVPDTPGSSRPSSPEWRRVPNGRSHYRRSFYDLD